MDRLLAQPMLTRAATVTAVLLALTAPALATPFEAFIDIETEEDLEDLLATQQIEPETFEALRALLDRGVDLDRAGRDELYSLPNLTYEDVDAILAYRKLNGFVADPADLVVAGALTERKLLAIAPFLIVRDRTRSAWEPHGQARVVTIATQANGDMVPIGLRARVTAGRHLTAGLVAALTRRQVGDVGWDATRNGFVADAPAVRAALPKLFVRYKADKVDAIAGTYRIGFGQRLTFDTALDYTPNGLYLDDQLARDYELTRSCVRSTGELGASPCAGDKRYEYETPDLQWSEGLRGLAGGVEHVPLGEGTLQAYGWASYQARDLYQYEIVDRTLCPDPREESAACRAPTVYERTDAPAAAALSYQTLPDVFTEALVGGNLTYFAHARDWLGLTAYGAAIDWAPSTPATVDLDFQEWSRYPTGGRFGAVGANAAFGRGLIDVFAEATMSFDQLTASGGPLDGGGGPAAIVRATHSRKKDELELSLRYYDPDFVNPYAGAIASADEVEGQRARGEHGARARYTTVLGAVALRSGLDLWRSLARTTTISGGRSFVYVPRGDVYVRADVAASDQLGWGLWVRYQDKGLSRPPRDPITGMAPPACFEIVYEDPPVDAPETCYGAKLTTTARLRVEPTRTVTLRAQAQHELVDDEGKRHDLSAYLAALWRPQPRLRLAARVRYLDEDVEDNAKLERSLRSYVEAIVGLRAKDRLRLRGDVVVYLDDRASTQARTPQPELWLTAEYQAKF